MPDLEGRRAALQEEARRPGRGRDLDVTVLRIEDAWHLRPEHPDEVWGADISSAVLDDGVRDPEGFASRLTRRASPVSGA